MNLKQFRELTKDLPETTLVHIAGDGWDEAIGAITVSHNTLLLAKDLHGFLPTESIVWSKDHE